MPVRVILPAALPSIVTGLKLGWTLASTEVSRRAHQIEQAWAIFLHGERAERCRASFGIMVLTILRFIAGLIRFD